MEGSEETGLVIDCVSAFEHLRAAANCERQAIEEDDTTAMILGGMAQTYRDRARYLVRYTGHGDPVERGLVLAGSGR